jgi:hypothetical protein
MSEPNLKGSPQSAPEPTDDGPSRRGPLIAMAVVLVLLVGGIWLSRTLHTTGRLQDCVMAGRNNCAPIGK